MNGGTVTGHVARCDRRLPNSPSRFVRRGKTRTSGLMKPVAPIFLLALMLTACSGSDRNISAKLTEQFDASTSAPINLAQVGPPTWERVCVIGPYATNQTAEQILGFKWNVQSRSSIGGNDGINLLVFLKDQEVLAFTEHRRDKGDFLKLQPKCLPRIRSTLARRVEADGWVQLVSE